jgi:putative nucleotidyltransferase with HDIG domain
MMNDDDKTKEQLINEMTEMRLKVAELAKSENERIRTEEALLQSIEKLRRSAGFIIDVVVMAVEARDPYTAGHQKRVTDLARSIATEMKLSAEIIDGIRMAGLIHDLGKISIPPEILGKPRLLNNDEYNLVKTHAEIGYQILKDIDFFRPVALIVYQHHERMNGTGYPQGLRGTEILLESRILAVADVVEAICTHRPYRPALGIDKALKEIFQHRGVLYDTEVVDVCIQLFREKGFSFKSRSN